MSYRSLRALADSLEREFMTAEDRRAWVTALRGMAKSWEWAAQDAAANRLGREEEEKRNV